MCLTGCDKDYTHVLTKGVLLKWRINNLLKMRLRLDIWFNEYNCLAILPSVAINSWYYNSNNLLRAYGKLFSTWENYFINWVFSYSLGVYWSWDILKWILGKLKDWPIRFIVDLTDIISARTDGSKEREVDVHEWLHPHFRLWQWTNMRLRTRRQQDTHK